jgi:hypothetical protein
VATFLSQSTVSEEVIPYVMSYLSDKFGTHVFYPKKIILGKIDVDGKVIQNI